MVRAAYLTETARQSSQAHNGLADIPMKLEPGPMSLGQFASTAELGRLEELLANLGDDFEYIDRTLYDIESFIDRALLSNADREHLKKLKKDVASQLKLYKSAMDADAYKNTFDLMMLKRLREDLSVPRLGLFYL